MKTGLNLNDLKSYIGKKATVVTQKGEKKIKSRVQVVEVINDRQFLCNVLGNNNKVRYKECFFVEDLIDKLEVS